jgi:hypothetical protein
LCESLIASSVALLTTEFGRPAAGQPARPAVEEQEDGHGNLLFQVHNILWPAARIAKEIAESPAQDNADGHKSDVPSSSLSWEFVLAARRLTFIRARQDESS